MPQACRNPCLAPVQTTGKKTRLRLFDESKRSEAATHKYSNSCPLQRGSSAQRPTTSNQDNISGFFTLRTVFVPMRAFFVSRCSFQFMKLLSFLFFIFQNHSIAKLEKKFFFQLFFQDFWNELFTQA